MLYSTLLVTAVVLAIVIPFWGFNPLYLSEPRQTPWSCKPAIELIASIPSVVLGLIGLLVLSPLVALLFGLPNGLNALTAAIVVAVMVLPTIASLCEDIFSSVPNSYRHASTALGSTKWQTISRVVVPSSISGVFAAVMLGFGRAVGETMAVLMVAGNALAPPSTFLDPARPLTANIAIEIKEVVFGSTHYQSLFAMGLVLFLITLLFNVAAEWVLRRHLKKLGL